MHLITQLRVIVLQDAPSLHQDSTSGLLGASKRSPSASSLGEMSLRAGIDQLARLRLQLSQMQGAEPPRQKP